MIMTYTQNFINKNVDMPDLADYVTTEDAARTLGFHVVSIRNMVKNGTLDGLKVGRSVLISKKSIDDYKRRTFGMSPNDPRRGRDQN